MARKARVTPKRKKKKTVQSSPVKAVQVQAIPPKAAPVQISPPEFHRRTQQEAYYLFERRGGSHGNDWKDWLEAERIVKSRCR